MGSENESSASEIEFAKREIVAQINAIHRLEGFDPGDAPQWFHDLTEAYVQGKVTAEQATQIALARITETPNFIDSNNPLELPAFVSFER
jgi:hypothetical protein